MSPVAGSEAAVRLRSAAAPAWPSMLRDVAAVIDHSLLRPEAGPADMDRLAAEALEHGFAAVCVHPVHVARIARRLERSPVAPCTVVGFPLGATLPEVKALEARRCQELGARELDMVLQVGLLRAGLEDEVRRDLEAVMAERQPDVVIKVILETGLLDAARKGTACRLAVEAGADFVKTCTGFTGGGATSEDVALMRAAVGPHTGIKASGGVRTLSDVRRLVLAGADRIGTSAGVSIMTEGSGP